VPKKVEQTNDHLFIDTYKFKNIKIGVNGMTVNDMTVNDSEICVRWKDEEHQPMYTFEYNLVRVNI